MSSAPSRSRLELALLATFAVGYLGGFVSALFLVWLTP